MHRFKSLVRGSAIVTLGTLASGVLSYAYSALMGRLLGPADFGDLGAINAYFILLTSVGGGLLTVTMYYTSALFARHNISGISRFYKKFSSYVFWGSLTLGVLAIVAAPLTAKFFSITDQRSLAFALTSIVFTLLLVVNRGVLQGTQKFGLLAVSNICEFGVKLVAAYFLVKAGFALSGATLAIPIGALAAYLLTVVTISRLTKNSNDSGSDKSFPTRREITLYFLPALVSNIALLLLMNLDILLVKKFFDPVLAGQYVAVSTIAKIIFYITGPITAVMFPLIAAQRNKGEKHYHTLIGAAAITIAGSALVLIVYAAFDQKIVEILYGSSYRSQAWLLPMSALLVIAISFINLMSQYFLSIQRYWFVAEMLIAAVTLLIYFLVKTPVSIESTLRYLLFGFSGLIVVMGADYLHMKRMQLKSLIYKNG